MKKIISFVLCVTMLGCLLCTGAVAVEITPSSVSEIQIAEAVATSEIQKFILSNDSIVTWNASTKISSYIELYDVGNNINGYVFRLETDDLPSGFIQVGKFGEDYIVMNLGFEGEDYLASMLYNNGLSETILESSKVYFLGNMNYFVYHENELVDLSNAKICNKSMEDLMEPYEDYVDYVTTELHTESTPTSISTLSTAATTVTVGNVLSSQLRTTGYYSGYSDHCAPTAATNLVLYWSVFKGYTALGTNPDTIFSYFYSNMNTNNNSDGTTGTKFSNIYGPIVNYFTSKISYASYGRCDFTGTTVDRAERYSDLCDLIDAGFPLQLEILQWTATGNHSVNVWGYNTGSGIDYLYITHNNSSGDYPGFSLINYTSYFYQQSETAGIG